MLAYHLAIDGDLKLGRPQDIVSHGIGIRRLAWIESSLSEHVVTLDLVAFLVLAELLLCRSLEDKLCGRNLLQVDILRKLNGVLEVTVAEAIYLETSEDGGLLS